MHFDLPIAQGDEGLDLPCIERLYEAAMALHVPL
jgi:hypothetical protein